MEVAPPVGQIRKQYRITPVIVSIHGSIVPLELGSNVRPSVHVCIMSLFVEELVKT